MNWDAKLLIFKPYTENKEKSLFKKKKKKLNKNVTKKTKNKQTWALKISQLVNCDKNKVKKQFFLWPIINKINQVKKYLPKRQHFKSALDFFKIYLFSFKLSM